MKLPEAPESMSVLTGICLFVRGVMMSKTNSSAFGPDSKAPRKCSDGENEVVLFWFGTFRSMSELPKNSGWRN